MAALTWESASAVSRSSCSLPSVLIQGAWIMRSAAACIRTRPPAIAISEALEHAQPRISTMQPPVQLDKTLKIALASATAPPSLLMRTSRGCAWSSICI